MIRKALIKRRRRDIAGQHGRWAQGHEARPAFEKSGFYNSDKKRRQLFTVIPYSQGDGYH